MKISRLKDRLTGLTDAFSRYPLTTIFLLVAAGINAVGISTEEDYSKYLLTFIVGAFLSAVFQVIYERFFSQLSHRIILMAVVVILTIGYFLIINHTSTFNLEITIRTSVALFALLFAFIWVPAIKNSVTFNQSFMISFKSFFNMILFSGVIYLGIMIIIAAIDQLIVSVSYHAYPHTANIVFVLFAPIYFLSLIPIYPGKANENVNNDSLNKINKLANCPRFLEILISYILVPLIAIFTLILIIYIATNFIGKFWTDNLLEPMLVSYAITVILVYILASELENKFTILFRKIVPKVLVPIVVFQIIASILKIGDTGIVYTRYYVILFGVFAAIVGMLLSFLPVRKNGIIAALVIAFSLISIVPPIDAFTVSRSNQIHLLEKVLLKNNMLEGNKIIANSSISNEDKKAITSTMNYLNMMEYTKELAWLPKDFNFYQDFNDTFGFDEYYHEGEIIKGTYLSLESKDPIDIKGYDMFNYSSVYIQKFNEDMQVTNFEKDGKTYTLEQKVTDNKVDIILSEKDKGELVRIKTQYIFDYYDGFKSNKGTINLDEATFVQENEKASLKLVVQNLNIDRMTNDTSYMMDYYLFVKIK